ncbi:MAG: CapA family protein [Thermacetogeniaceae bacterium]|nr:CapA family protein [Syntrophomonadaceae bacterium]
MGRRKGNNRIRFFFGVVVLLLVLSAVFYVGQGWWNNTQPVDKQDQQEQQHAQQPPAVPKEWSMVVCGDVMLGRGVATAMSQNGMFYPFEQMAPYLKSADLTFGNLESPLSRQGTPIPGKGIWLRGDPKAAAALKEAGFDVLSLANNHILDFESPALLDTMEYLREQGIDPVGAGKDLEEAVQPVIKEVNGYKIAFIAATEMADIFWDYSYPRTFEAREDRPGVQKLDPDQLVEAVAALKGNVDLIAVSLHWGTEYSDYPLDVQRDIAHRLVDAGAKLVLGHHPHCLQGMEVYKDSLIAYSLGNFVFDKQRRPKCQETVLMKIIIKDIKIEKAEVIPVMIIDAQPRPAEKADGERILQKLKKLCSELETNFTVDDNKGMITIIEGGSDE